MNYTKKAVRGASLVFLMLSISSLIAYGLRILIARSLPPEEYGLFYAVLTFMLLFLIFRGIGLGSALTKFIAQYAAEKNYRKIKTLIVSAFLFQLLSSSLLIVFFILIAKQLSISYFKSPISQNMLILLSFYVLFSFLQSLTHRTLMGFQDTKWYMLAEPLRLGFTLIAIFIFFQRGLGIMAPVYGFVVGVALSFVVLLGGIVKYSFILKYPMQDFWKTTKELFQFGIPVIFTSAGYKVIAHIDVLILTYLISLEGVGIYNVILPTAILFLFLGKAISPILFPMISELWAKKDMIRITEGLDFIYTYAFVITIPLLFAVFMFADVFIRVLFGGAYVSGILAFRILLLGVLCYIIAIVNNTAISGIGKPAIVTKIILKIALLNIILNLILIPQFKLTGAAIATATSYLTTLILSTKALMKFVKTAAPWKKWSKIFFAGLIFVLIIYLIKLTPMNI